MEINLSDVDPADTIYIMDATRLTLQVNTFGKSLKGIQYLIDNRVYSYGHEVIIYPSNMADGTYKLTVLVTVSSGTGSLADMMEMEGYLGEMNWNVRIMKNFDPGLKLGFRKNADNFLELYWETSKYVPEAIFEKYEVSVSKNLIITNQEKKSAVFEDYIYGWAGGSVDLYIKCTGGYSRYYHKVLSFDSPEPKLYFEPLDVNRLRVFWDKPFSDAKYELVVINSQIPSLFASDTSVVVSMPPFTETRGYWVKMYPKNSTSVETNFYISGGYHLGNRGTIAYDVAYYGHRNQIFAIYYRQLLAIDIQTFAQTIQIDLVEPGYETRISCVPGSNKIAVKQTNSSFVYDDDSYINPVIIYKSPENIYRSTDFFGLTNNDRLLIVYDYSTNCDVYDANTGALLYTFEVEARASRSVSADGKYLCCASANGLTIYLMGTSDIENVTTLPGSYTNALFNPANPKQLVVKQDNDIKILEEPGFQSIYTLTAANSTLLDVDPANGNILYHRRYVQQDSLHVIRTMPVFEPAFAVASSRRDYVKLKGNLLMEYIHHNYFLDITPYLKP